MEGGFKRNINPESTSDLISNLPCNVIECILSRLPIRDAARTSILSTKWRYQWVTLSHLVFHDLGNDRNFYERQPTLELVKVINGVLMHHNGPILKFVLSIRNAGLCSFIDQWICFLSKNGIEELFLDVPGWNRHELSSYFFSCRHLRHLSLQNCCIKPPPAFTGFPRLISLDIRKVTILSRAFESFITNCPLLERLNLIDLDGLDCLNIYAPNLAFLWIRGTFKSMHVKYAPLLFSMRASLTNVPDIFEQTKLTNSSSLFDAVGLSRIKRLALNPEFLKFLALGNGLSDTLVSLKHLTMYRISFNNLDMVSSALCLIRNSPNLQCLRITVCTDADVDMRRVVEFMKAQNQSNCCLKQLSNVEIQDITCEMPEMEFIKFLLANSPMLVIMKIVCIKKHPLYIESRMSKELIHSTQASPIAQILYSR